MYLQNLLTCRTQTWSPPSKQKYPDSSMEPKAGIRVVYPDAGDQEGGKEGGQRVRQLPPQEEEKQYPISPQILEEIRQD